MNQEVSSVKYLSVSCHLTAMYILERLKSHFGEKSIYFGFILILNQLLKKLQISMDLWLFNILIGKKSVPKLLYITVQTAYRVVQKAVTLNQHYTSISLKRGKTSTNSSNMFCKCCL